MNTSLLKKEIVAPIIIVVTAMVLCAITKKILRKLLKLSSKNNDRKTRTIVNLISNIARAIIIFIAIIMILEIYGIDTKSLVASLSVVGVIVGLAVQDILKDLISGISIIFEGQYSIGDWININGFIGEVLPTNLKTTKIRAYTGEVKIIPNRNITEIINYSTFNNTLIMDLDVSYDSDIEKVKATLNNVCQKFKEEKKLKEVTNLGLQKLDSSSIVFRIIMVSSYDKKASLERDLREQIFKEFSKNNIEIPYNKLVIYNG